jgi:polar amino acid transport system substrate-binding protein
MALLGGIAAARAQTVADIKAKGKLVVGVMVDVPPFALLDENNQPTGYDADMAKMLAQRMGVPLEMVVVTGPNRIPYLLTGKVDMLVAVLGIIPDRTKVVLFSKPYAGFSNFIYGRKELPIHSMADLKGLTVAVPRANTSDIMLTREAPRGTNILRFDDDAAVRAALLARQVDATSMSSLNLPDIEKIVGKDIYERKFDLLTQVQGVAVRPGQTELVSWVNAQIDDMTKNGQLEALNKKWTGMPLPDLTMPKP